MENNNYNYNVSVNVKLSDEMVKDIITTALEGGIGYWACLIYDTPEWERAHNRCREKVGPDKPLFYCDVIKDIFDHDDAVTFIDEETSELDEIDPKKQEVWKLTKEKFLHGCQLYDQQYGNIKREFDDGTFDATCADAIFQLALFSEIIYG